ncbi:MAG TPA: response regulator [Anaerolineaceae bacterium]|mgnify:CR=1 FL=1|nr:response regulator [Anaerolineaceae bacterium]
MKYLDIDNDPAIIDIIQSLPVETPPTIIYTSAPKDGIMLLRFYQPEFIFIGAILDGVSGIDLCKVVRQFSRAPLFITSALDDPKILVAALNAGADDYLIKPISSRVLAAKVNASIRRFATRPLEPTHLLH